MTNQVIPEAAAEAARHAVYQVRWVDAYGPSGRIATDEAVARAALEAALPHIAAMVLESAADALIIERNQRLRAHSLNEEAEDDGREIGVIDGIHISALSTHALAKQFRAIGAAT